MKLTFDTFSQGDRQRSDRVGATAPALARARTGEAVRVQGTTGAGSQTPTRYARRTTSTRREREMVEVPRGRGGAPQHRRQRRHNTTNHLQAGERGSSGGPRPPRHHQDQDATPRTTSTRASTKQRTGVREGQGEPPRRRRHQDATPTTDSTRAGVAPQRRRQRHGAPGTTSTRTVVGDDAHEPTCYGFDHLHAGGRGASAQPPTAGDTRNHLQEHRRGR